MNKINTYTSLLIILLSAHLCAMERSDSKLSKWTYNREVKIEQSQKDKRFFGCTIIYNPITSSHNIMENAILIGCEIRPAEEYLNKTARAILTLVANDPDKENNALKRLQNVFGFWVTINGDLQLKNCCIIGLETNRWPSTKEEGIFISKKQVTYAGGTFVGFLGVLLYLLK